MEAKTDFSLPIVVSLKVLFFNYSIFVLTSRTNTYIGTYIYLFVEKYDYVGKLLKPGEQPQDYSDTEDEQSEEKRREDKKMD